MEPVEALKRGEKEAISWLVDTFSQRLLKAATLILGDQSLAEDAVQDCFLDAIASLPTFRAAASVYTWLYAILLRRCSRLRKKRGRSLALFASSADLERMAIPESDQRRLVESKQQVREAISALKYKYREVIVLHYYAGFSLKEMAALLAEPEGTVKNRLYRARQQLKELLEEGDLCL